MRIPNTIHCDDLDEAIDQYTKRLGYRLDMIVPADNPREALLSRNGEALRLVLSSSFSWPTHDEEPTKVGTQNEWMVGRAGMEYRDLIPGRLGGRMIASHIRLIHGGEVPDYVHYHKVEFQMIFCLKGSIRVVYEDQGPPFWLETGDCVLQPPEIRHRVLECTAGAEVIEVSMPAVHETWVEHVIELPTAEVKPDRDFGGQRFVRHIAANSAWERSDIAGLEARDTGIAATTGGMADVRVIRAVTDGEYLANKIIGCEFNYYFVLSGKVKLRIEADGEKRFGAGGAFVISRNEVTAIDVLSDVELLQVTIF